MSCKYELGIAFRTYSKRRKRKTPLGSKGQRKNHGRRSGEFLLKGERSRREWEAIYKEEPRPRPREVYQ
jgi:hypothetical protein